LRDPEERRIKELMSVFLGVEWWFKRPEAERRGRVLFLVSSPATERRGRHVQVKLNEGGFTYRYVTHKNEELIIIAHKTDL